MGLQEAINERVSFLKEQINPKNKPEVNAGFQVQMDMLRTADTEKIAILVLLYNTYTLSFVFGTPVNK